MRFLMALLMAGILVSCGTDGPTGKSTRTARDGRIYVANEGRWEVDDSQVLENPTTGQSGLWAPFGHASVLCPCKKDRGSQIIPFLSPTQSGFRGC